VTETISARDAFSGNSRPRGAPATRLARELNAADALAPAHWRCRLRGV